MKKGILAIKEITHPTAKAVPLLIEGNLWKSPLEKGDVIMVIIEAMECMRDGLESVPEDLCGKESIPMIKAITHPTAKAVPLPENPRDILRDRRDFTSFNLLEGNMGRFPLNKGGTKRGML